MPTLGFALAATTVGTYLPVVVADTAGSATAIGALIAVEGVLALFLPVVVGARSDRLRTRIGGRLPFVLAGVPVMALALVLLGLQDALWPALAIVIVLFAAYYVAYEPYRAMYPDLVPERDAGRSQSAQAVARGVGTGLALVGGGLLLAIAQIVPFVVAAGILLATTGAFIWALLRRERPLQQEQTGAMRARAAFGEVRRLLVELPGLRAFFAANALWEGALGAIRTFVVLWVTTGLGLSLP
ncbi:MAG: MFS transporter, partial [Thermoleophilia bacterium]